ncbi:dolichyl-phosphate beta-glucosyltransferase [Candidatus Chlorohelix sp.]|uniref:dolichyl-phosphate beta-glucosyltransferase n=1 Tax=Candidatus Chlorohelix sp. TaxID=3139201 RepID=UPI00302E5E41
MPDKDALVEIVIPVYNEEVILEKSVNTLRDYLSQHFPYRWRITIANNASKDRTLEIARRLEATYPDVHVCHLDQKGRGRALRTAWSQSDADVVSYMDVDLSTNLQSFLPLIAPIITRHSDMAIGSRLAKGARVTRQWKRESISRIYNLILKLFFWNNFTDAQCGFKAGRTSIVKKLLTQIENQEWFFDSEMLLLAEEKGIRIYEVPVDWIEDLDTRVNISKTASEDLKGCMRVWKQRRERRLHEKKYAKV